MGASSHRLGVAAIFTDLFRLSAAFRDDPVENDRLGLRFRVVLGILQIGLGAVLILPHAPTSPMAIGVV